MPAARLAGRRRQPGQAYRCQIAGRQQCKNERCAANDTSAKNVGLLASSIANCPVVKLTWMRSNAPIWNAIVCEGRPEYSRSATPPLATGSKKSPTGIAPFKESIAPAAKDDVLEVDELFTFVGCKANQTRIWVVVCRRTRQILSFFLGDGSMTRCKRLWRKLPYDYQ